MLRYIITDRDRKAVIYIDNVKLADVLIPSSTPNADENGFYNIEFRIPDELLVDSKGNVKRKLTIRAEASEGTLLPGLYYLWLLKDWKE